MKYIDTVTGEYLPDQYGRCDREINCPYHLDPYKDGYAKMIWDQEQGNRSKLPNNWKPQLKKIQFVEIFSAPSKLIDYSEKYFTEIDAYAKGDNYKGVLFHYSILELRGRLNDYISDGNKTSSPAILKGIYKNGTAGEFCEASAPFLFFDIDVKETENPGLLNPETNQKVFEALKDFCLLVWRSNSQKGIAGIISFPQLSTIGTNEAEKHLQAAKQGYKYLSEYIKQSTGIDVIFDNQQGKFRQIRFLAEQKQQREINKNSKSLMFQILPFVPFPKGIFKQTLQPERYKYNAFIQNLLTRVSFPFTKQDIEKVISLYHLGTVQNGYRSGAITFPFIDVAGNIRAVQVKQFDETNHTTGTDFLHSTIEKYHTRNNDPLPEWLEAYNKNETKVSCLFGEHLLSKYPHNPVALVEAPKTAIYGTLYFGNPDQPKNLLWLAVYNLSSLNLEKCRVLKGRKVVLFPDLSKDGKAFELWSNKAKEIQKQLPGTVFKVSDLLEQLAPDRHKEQGNDLADFLIKLDWRLFRKQNIQEQPPQPEPQKVTGVTKVTHQQNILFSPVAPFPKVEVFKSDPIEDWSNDIAELENYFSGIELPKDPVRLNACSTIINISLFIKSHLTALKANNGKKIVLPHLNRLRSLKAILIK